MIVDRTVLGLMMRGVFTGRRTLMLGALSVLPVIAAIFAATGDIDTELWWARMVQRLLLPVIVAFVAVVIGAGAIADQREDGTILYLAATPLRRTTLAGCAVAAAWLASMALIVPSLLATGAIALGGNPSPGALGWPLAAAALAALAYCALGVLAAMVLRQPVVAAVLYILLWEGTVANWSDSAEYLSVAAYARALATRGVETVNVPQVGAVMAAIVLALAALASTLLAARRLGRTELP